MEVCNAATTFRVTGATAYQTFSERRLRNRGGVIYYLEGRQIAIAIFKQLQKSKLELRHSLAALDGYDEEPLRRQALDVIIPSKTTNWVKRARSEHSQEEPRHQSVKAT